jgi:hypothetical protein
MEMVVTSPVRTIVVPCLMLAEVGDVRDQVP